MWRCSELFQHFSISYSFTRKYYVLDEYVEHIVDCAPRTLVYFDIGNDLDALTAVPEESIIRPCNSAHVRRVLPIRVANLNATSTRCTSTRYGSINIVLILTRLSLIFTHVTRSVSLYSFLINLSCTTCGRYGALSSVVKVLSCLF